MFSIEILLAPNRNILCPHHNSKSYFAKIGIYPGWLKPRREQENILLKIIKPSGGEK